MEKKMKPTRELKEYFEIKYGRKAVEAYVLFSDKVNWGIVEKIKMYQFAKNAFKVSSINQKSTVAFKELFEALKSFKVFRNKSPDDHWSYGKIYEVLFERCKQCFINESISLKNLNNDDIKLICSCIRELKEIKHLRSKKTPIMAISKFLHFYNPKLFPMYDTTYVNNRLLSIFKRDWNDFTRGFNLSNCQNEDQEFKKYIQYIYWAQSFFKNPNKIMQCIYEKIKQIIQLEFYDLKQYYGLGFEIISLGACELERCLYYKSILSDMICNKVSK